MKIGTKGKLRSAFAKVAGVGVWGTLVAGTLVAAAFGVVAGPPGWAAAALVGWGGGSIAAGAGGFIHDKVKYGW